MRRAYAERARHLGDPDFNPGDARGPPPLEGLRGLAAQDHPRGPGLEVSAPTSFEWPAESAETTHLSVVDEARNAVSLTYTLEDNFGSKIVVPGAGFLLNNEMGDFNAGPGLTNVDGPDRHRAEPGRAGQADAVEHDPDHPGPGRQGSSWSSAAPAVGPSSTPCSQCIVNVVDFGLNIQEAIDAPRFHHQWLPDRIRYERIGISPDTLALLRAKGHELRETAAQGVAEGIVSTPRRTCSRAARIGAPPTEPRWAASLDAARPPRLDPAAALRRPRVGGDSAESPLLRPGPPPLGSRRPERRAAGPGGPRHPLRGAGPREELRVGLARRGLGDAAHHAAQLRLRGGGRRRRLHRDERPRGAGRSRDRGHAPAAPPRGPDGRSSSDRAGPFPRASWASTARPTSPSSRSRPRD